MAAAQVYDETKNPNAASPMPNWRVICGPKGIMIMKSTMWLN
jgi:hypothetical protein